MVSGKMLGFISFSTTYWAMTHGVKPQHNVCPTFFLKGNRMRNLFILLGFMLCSSCAQLPPSAIPNAPPKQEQAVVFDIDGTLTPKVFDIVEARTDAANGVSTFAKKGYKIIYLSTRISWLSAGIPSWLKKHNFPDGSVHVTQTDEDRSHPYDFKTRTLKDFIDHGWDIKYAYGDSSTDFAAYAAVGIPKERVFALLRDGETLCESGDWKECLNGWTKHLEFITKSVPSVPAN